VAKGQLAAAGSLADLSHFQVLGWELVMSGVPAAALDRLRSRARRVQPVAGDRYVIDLPPDGQPEEVARELSSAGAALVSINPLRETLEDVFVRRVAEVGQGARSSTELGRTR
jgi:hypothetical protein